MKFFLLAVLFVTCACTRTYYKDNSIEIARWSFVTDTTLGRVRIKTIPDAKGSCSKQEVLLEKALSVESEGAEAIARGVTSAVLSVK